MPKVLKSSPQAIDRIKAIKSLSFTREEVVGMICHAIKEIVPVESSLHISVDPSGSMIVHITYPWQEPEGGKADAPAGQVQKSSSTQEEAFVEKEEKPKGF